MYLYVSYVFHALHVAGSNVLGFGSGYYQCDNLDEVSPQIIEPAIEKATGRTGVMVLAWSEPQEEYINQNVALGPLPRISRTFTERQ